MTLLKKYKPYFYMGLVFGFILSALGIISAYFDPGVRTFKEMVVFSLILFGLLGQFLGIIFFILIKVYAPKKKTKVLEHNSLRPFYKLGFNKEEKILKGIYSGYLCEISWELNSPLTHNRTCILFYIPCKVPLIETKELKIKYSKDSLLWYEDGVVGCIDILLKIPKHEKLKNKLDSIISILKTQKIQPIDNF